MPLLSILVVLAAGVALAVQAPTNAMLARVSGSVVFASLVSFVVGTAALALLWLATDRTMPASMRSAPWWVWIGGLYGAGFVAAMAFAAPRLGLSVTLTIAIASQLMAAIAIDQWGLFGLRATPVTASRLVGVALVLAGVVLVRRG